MCLEKAGALTDYAQGIDGVGTFFVYYFDCFFKPQAAPLPTRDVKPANSALLSEQKSLSHRDEILIPHTPPHEQLWESCAWKICRHDPAVAFAL